MKIEVNLEKKYFFGIMLIGLIAIGLAGVVAYYSDAGDPSIIGHSPDEIDFSAAISGNVTASGFCIGNDETKSCIDSWGAGGAVNLVAGKGIVLTSVAGGTMINSTAVEGGGTIDTKCDIAGVCSQVCAGNKCVTNLNAVAAYRVTNNNCDNDGGISFDSKCSTKGGCMPTVLHAYYTCSGVCQRHDTPYLCDNVLVGYLVK